jgi:hypothetical protein
MGKNPYSSNELGQTIRDVRDKISKELELDADLLEMVVANKILSIDLPINLVYEKVWWPYIC